ncbi:protein NLP3-like isoform X2 [Chenopodium quinoa]|uniref:protein NLP3-like isoform X2 n=1 Tax=Chenopodium quinoa TaxID=63459 RepID=UPI000B77DA5D|nr:protein NLP3-like isoform X2 [Chenopodium quinoa]
MNWNKSKCLKICQTVEIQTDGSCKKKIDMLWLEIRCYDCVRIRDKLKDVIYSLLALFDRPTWATVMLRDLSKSNHKVCRLFFARIFANDWRKHLVFVSELTFYTCKLSSSASCDLEAKHKNSTNGSDNKSPSTNLLLHPIEIQHNKSITLNINNGADQKKKCQNTSVNKGKEVNFLKRKRGKEEKKVSLEDINSYISRSFTLIEAAECLKVSRSTLKRKCRQLGISQWQPNNRIKRFRRTSQSKKVSEISSKLEVASLKSISSALDDDVVNQCMQAPCTSKTEPKFPSQSKKVILDSISLRPDDVSQNKSVYGTQSDEGLLSRLKAATLNSIVSMKDLSQYMTKYDTHKSEKVAQFGSSSRDVKQYKCLNQNLSDHRSLVLFPITHSHACNRTTSDTNKGNTITNDKLVESNEEIFVHSSAIGQYSSVFSPPLKQARVQDGMTSLIKATYKDDMVRFHFSFKENITGLKKEVARRLNLKLGTFKMKYLDDEDEWTLLASDLDWQEFIYISRSSRKNAVRLLVQDIQREEEDKGDLEITLLKL